MPRRHTRGPQGPTVTTVTYSLREVEEALIAYSEARGGPLPAGSVQTIKLANHRAPKDAAMIKIDHSE